MKEGASSLLKLSNEYLIENIYFSKILIFLCSALETYKPIDFGKKAIYGAFAKLTKNLEQGEKDSLAIFSAKIFFVFKNRGSLFVFLSIFLQNQVKEQRNKSVVDDAFREITQDLEISDFAATSGYCYESLEVILLLIYWGDEEIKALSIRILCRWSFLCSNS